MTELEQAKLALAELAVENQNLKREVSQLKDTAQRRRDWLAKAKQAAGYTQDVSFDMVWADVLEQAKEAGPLPREKYWTDNV